MQQLQVAWTYHTGDVSDGKQYPILSAFECTPVVSENVMYLTTPFCRVIALDAETGKQRWAFDPKLDKTKPYNLFINRGVALARVGNAERVFLGTLDGRLFALDARDGQPVKSFGNGGFIDLRVGVADKFPQRAYGMTSPPVVYQNLVICGSLVSDGEPQGPSGDVRAFDATTGKLVWTFHVVPRPGEFGNDTWEKDSWMDRGGVNVWSLMSLDAARGIVYLPTTSPAPDRYGGERKGQNLFGNSLVALDARTGKRLWHYQIIHHDLWDWDLPAQPNLFTMRRNGKAIPAVAQITKMGFLFVFDRVTGKPLFDITERAMPPSNVPGEQAWPTQPFPAIPPIARQTFTRDDLTNVTPESRKECLSIIEGATLGAMYQPQGLETTVIFPGTNGGPNWGGASIDPRTNHLFVNSMDAGQVLRMLPAPEGSAAAYRPRGIPQGRFWDRNQYPCQKPPWGTLTSVDLNTGKIRWQVPLGIIEELEKRGVPQTGAPNLGGSIVTAGDLVFIAATNDSRFRAFDAATGKEVWVTKLPASGHATPMTFRGKTTGKQFVVIAAGGGNKYNKTFSDALVAFALP
ncbi:MAG TPA: pyrroloquinoline quinone-dependent dehydrogenase [Blastocatellia bacterium]|nr:pyrroloquinoline quinone-dependent dehydrogenase [Blastocatellia bacterium]